jgi:hypothetical protein
MYVILLTAILAADPNARVYNEKQEAFLRQRKPWLVLQADGHSVKLIATNPAYGHRLAFSQTVITNGKGQKLTEDIFAIPHNKDVYWLRRDEFSVFEELGKSKRISPTLLMFFAILFLCPLIKAVRKKPYRRRAR